MLFLTLLLIIFKLIKSDKCPFKETTKTSSQTVTISDFNNLNELSFNQCKTIKISILELKPNKKIILDNSLNLTGLTLTTQTIPFHIKLINFKGFDLLSHPFEDVNFIGNSLEYIDWSIENSNFNFFINNKLITEKQCLNNNSNWSNFIKNSIIYQFDAYYSLNTCPYIFKDTIIASLALFNIRSSYIDSNILSFLKIKNDINSNIFHAGFIVYRAHFNDNLFNEAIFKNTKSLYLYGIINSIQTDLFKAFNQMKLIQIHTQHVKQLFSRNNKWFEYLNFHFKPIENPDEDVVLFMKKSIYLMIYQTFPRVTFYDYPNEDFCFFNKFPHNKLVFPQLRPSHTSNCSCTEIYLIQYSFKFKFAIDFYSNQVKKTYNMFQYYFDDLTDKSFSKCVQSINELNILVKKCDFKLKLEKCKIKSIIILREKNDNYSYFEMYDWDQVRKISNLIFSVYLNNIFSLIIIILNVLTLKILKSKSVLREKNPMYNFLYINTILCLIYITICLFKIIGICVDNDFYCSPLVETKFNTYYKVIFVLFIGESIKTASNFSFISFTLSRYMKVTSRKFDKLKNYLLIASIVAVFINLYHLFEFNFNIIKPAYFLDTVNNFESFFKYSNPNDEFVNLTKFQYYLLNTFFYIKLIFSDFVYIVLNLIIDLRLLSFIRMQQIKNLRSIERLNVPSKLSQIKSTTNRVTFMIVLNGLNCFILRFPGAFSSFYGFIFRYDKADNVYRPSIPAYIVCHSFKFCPNLQEILYFLYLISLLLQFLIFLKFDKIFYKGFIEIKNNFTKIFKI